MPRVDELKVGIFEVRFVEPGFSSERDFEPREDPDEIAYWLERFARWEQDIETLTAGEVRERHVRLWERTRPTPTRTKLIRIAVWD